MQILVAAEIIKETTIAIKRLFKGRGRLGFEYGYCCFGHSGACGLSAPGYGPVPFLVLPVEVKNKTDPGCIKRVLPLFCGSLIDDR